MTNKNVLITGGAGYVGAVLVPLLLKKGYRVRVLDLFLYGDVLTTHKNLECVRGDIRDPAVIKKSLKGIDTVIHLACISNDPSFELDPTLGKSINFDATTALIDQSKKAGVRRFIYASSSSVYGVKAEKNVTEDLPLEPLTDYSKYKARCEQYLLSKQDGDFTPVIIRPATVCGYSPRMRLDLSVNILTMSALTQKSITVFGGAQKRPNIHITDMCRAYMTLLESPKKKIAGKIYNAGYQNYSVMELALMVKRVLGDPSIVIDVKPTNDNRSYHISSEKIKNELGFTSRHTVEEAIGDIKIAYERGLLPDVLTNKKYYNIRVMQANFPKYPR
ncbi:MAG: SDR family oxidoreductase [Candidatus Gottesmanbacteria bacterium]|nr:SDR family oxidoreductase [Candidatus Gottesmanbacteria bacterium]